MFLVDPSDMLLVNLPRAKVERLCKANCNVRPSSGIILEGDGRAIYLG
jgi:hypothetical protein